MTTINQAHNLTTALAGVTMTNRHPYRRLAQLFATDGLLAVVVEDNSNCAADDPCITYSLKVFPDPVLTPVGQTSQYRQYLTSLGLEHELKPDARVTPVESGDHLNPPLFIDGPMGGGMSFEVFRPGMLGGSAFGTMPPEEIDRYDAA